MDHFKTNFNPCEYCECINPLSGVSDPFICAHEQAEEAYLSLMDEIYTDLTYLESD